jgi:4-amino-4-deoxy-L-arabinose transferase-like glycosyltransferase
MKSNFLPWTLAALFLAALLPTLDATRLMEVDELTHATVAKELAERGSWMPLTLHGQPWCIKPPLMIWVAAALARASGNTMASWPYRLGPCLGAAACLAALAELGILEGLPLLGLFAASAFGLQGDLLFHSRFFTMDTAMLGCMLWSLVFLAKGKPVACAAMLFVGVWVKSLFVLAWLPPLLYAAWAGRDRLPWRSSFAWILGGSLAGLGTWFALYLAWYGSAFVHYELGQDLWLRLASGGMNERSGSNFRFYTWWAGLGAGGLLPLALAAPMALLQRRGAVAAFAMAFPLYWYGLLALVHAQVINYLLPAEAAVCLAWALCLGQAKQARAWWLCLLLGLASWRLILPEPEGGIVFALSLVAGLALIHFGQERPQWGPPARLAQAAAVLMMLPLLSKGAAFLRHPPDPSRQLADTLLQHPPRQAGEILDLAGENTQAIAFYSRYNVRVLPGLPRQRPQEATLVNTKQGWIFYPPLP